MIHPQPRAKITYKVQVRQVVNMAKLAKVQLSTQTSILLAFFLAIFHQGHRGCYTGNTCAHECEFFQQAKNKKQHTHKTTNNPNLLISLSIEMHPEHTGLWSICQWASTTRGTAKYWWQSHTLSAEKPEGVVVHTSKNSLSSLTIFFCAKCAVFPSRTETKISKYKKSIFLASEVLDCQYKKKQSLLMI